MVEGKHLVKIENHSKSRKSFGKKTNKIKKQPPVNGVEKDLVRKRGIF